MGFWGDIFATSQLTYPQTTPWFTGPLLAPSGHTTPSRTLNMESYLSIRNTFGKYGDHWNTKNVTNLWAIEPLVNVSYGLNPFADIEAIASLLYQKRSKANAMHFTDTVVFLGVQILEDQQGEWIPDLRVTLLEIFPTGKYDKLNPNKKGTDESGEGSYKTGIGFNFQKIFKTGKNNYFRERFTLQYIFLPLRVNIKGFNVYGGNYMTKGKISPGQTIHIIWAGEYTIANNWAFAMDIVYNFKRHDHFFGEEGIIENHKKIKVGNPISHQISIAPALEYNFSENFGIIGGFWFTLAGRNTNQFLAGLFAVNLVW